MKKLFSRFRRGRRTSANLNGPTEAPTTTDTPTEAAAVVSADPPEESTLPISSIKKKSGRFRILIIGRVNAGKTTIIKQISGSNSTEDPVVYDEDGNVVKLAKIEGTGDRGMHDIGNGLIFRSNPSLIFHDSRGFEAGSIEDFEKMKNFVSEGATAPLEKQIHVIWYCIPMDQYHRAVLAAEEKFFGECDTGKVPVILVLTKCDVLLVEGLAALTPEEKKLPLQERLPKGWSIAKTMLKTNPAWEQVRGMRYPPRAFVELRDLHHPEEAHDERCKPLIERTLRALNDEALQMLLVTSIPGQQTDIMLCIEYATERVLIHTTSEKYKNNLPLIHDEQKKIWNEISSWFPYIQPMLPLLPLSSHSQPILDSPRVVPDSSTIAQDSMSSTSISSLESTPWSKVLQLGVGFAIILEHSFFLHQQGNKNPIAAAAELYQTSGIIDKVKNAISELIPEYKPEDEQKMKQLIMQVISQNLISKNITVRE